MKKFLLFVSAAAAGLLPALDMPQVSVKPTVNTLDTALWAKVTSPDQAVKYSAVYDKDNLYVITEIAQTDNVYAGEGRGFANYNDGVEIRVSRGNHGFLQLWIDAANQVYTTEKYQVVSRGNIRTASQMVPGKGYRIFAAIPWSRLLPDSAAPGNVRLAVIRVKVPKAFKYDRVTIVDTLKPVDKIITFDTGAPAAEKDSGFKVMNFGRSGYSSKELLGQLPAIFDYNPKLLILLIGTNDVVYKKKWQTPEQFAVHYRNICEKLRQQKCKVILITLPPCVENVANVHIQANKAEKAQLNTRILKMNDYIRNFGKEFGFAVYDYHKVFTGDLESKSSLMRVPANCGIRDGIHPNEAGYKLLAAELKKIIDKNNYPTDGIVCVGDSITYGAHMKGQGSVKGDTYPAQLLKLLEK